MNRVLLALATALVASLATAQQKVFDWTEGAQNEEAGKLNRLTTSFDNNTQRFTMRANFGAVPGTNLKTDGFWVALSGGANPKGHGGELALLYFDATGETPTLTAYNYNGVDGNTSYRDGSPEAGDQAPDRIKSSLLDISWINDIQAFDEADGSRTMRFDIDATEINSHNPAYPGNSPWTGLAYGDQVGIWFHHTAGSSFAYQDGFIDSFGFAKQGWLDLQNQGTTTVPEPATLAALGLGVAAFFKRRRA